MLSVGFLRITLSALTSFTFMTLIFQIKFYSFYRYEDRRSPLCRRKCENRPLKFGRRRPSIWSSTAVHTLKIEVGKGLTRTYHWEVRFLRRAMVKDPTGIQDESKHPAWASDQGGASSISVVGLIFLDLRFALNPSKVSTRILTKWSKVNWLGQIFFLSYLKWEDCGL